MRIKKETRESAGWEKRDRQRQFPVDSFRFFITSWRKVSAPGPISPSSRSILVASTGRIYLRWVYLRTKWFLFGSRASCASHGGFVAAITAAWRKRVRQANKSKDAPRVGEELLHGPPLLGLSQPSLLHPFACMRLCNCAYMCVRPT